MNTRFDRRVQLFAPGAMVDDGQRKVAGPPVSIGFRWASIKPARGRELVQAQGREAQAPMSFWLRFDSVTRALTERNFILYGGHRWEIIAPPMEVERQRAIEIIAVAGALPE